MIYTFFFSGNVHGCIATSVVGCVEVVNDFILRELVQVSAECYDINSLELTHTAFASFRQDLANLSRVCAIALTTGLLASLRVDHEQGNQIQVYATHIGCWIPLL